MIQLKLRRTNSIFGSWACEELGKDDFHDPIGIGHSIQEAIEDFEKTCLILIGVKPDYKWS